METDSIRALTPANWNSTASIEKTLEKKYHKEIAKKKRILFEQKIPWGNILLKNISIQYVGFVRLMIWDQTTG